MTATDAPTSTVSELTASHIETTEKYAAHNYHPLPVVLARGEGELFPGAIPLLLALVGVLTVAHAMKLVNFGLGSVVLQ